MVLIVSGKACSCLSPRKKRSSAIAATCCVAVLIIALRLHMKAPQHPPHAIQRDASADTTSAAHVTAGADNARMSAATAYARQRDASEALLTSMRAAPDAWHRGCMHGPTKALWIDPFRDFYRCPHTVEKVGSLADGGKWVCGVDALLQRPGCVVYSFGSNGDTAFEEAILQRTACSVWTFDPTLDTAAAAKVAAVPGLNFTAVGLAAKDGMVDIQGVRRPVRTLRTLMQERGHAWVDVLKMDIEGAEWPVLDAFVNLQSRLPVTQALIELHVRQPAKAINTLAGLLELGMRSFHVEENNYCASCACKLYEVAFMHVDGTAEGQPVVGPA